MDKIKNVLLVAVIVVLGFSQFTSPPKSIPAQSAQEQFVKNDSIIDALYWKIRELEGKIQSLDRKLYGANGSISLFPTSIKDLESKIDELKDDVQDIKGSYSYSSPNLSSLDSEINDLKRSSHSH